MKIADGTFARKSPASFAERAELPMGWTVLRFSHLPEKEQRRATHGHWVAMICGSNKIYRIVRYSVDLPTRQVVLDWAGWIELQGRVADLEAEIPILVRTPRFWEYPVIPFNHIDPGYRMSAWLGALSVVLGLLSLGLAIDLQSVIGGFYGGLISLGDKISNILQHFK